MNGQRQRGIRRIVLGGLVVVVAALTALGDGSGALAEKKYPFPDQKSAAAFKQSCENGGGTFTGPTPFGYTICSKGGNKITCDKNGQNCTTNVPPALVGGAEDPRAPGVVDAVIFDDSSPGGATVGGRGIIVVEATVLEGDAVSEPETDGGSTDATVVVRADAVGTFVLLEDDDEP